MSPGWFASPVTCLVYGTTWVRAVCAHCMQREGWLAAGCVFCTVGLWVVRRLVHCGVRSGVHSVVYLCGATHGVRCTVVGTVKYNFGSVAVALGLAGNVEHEAGEQTEE